MSEESFAVQTQEFFRDLLNYLYQHGGDFQQSAAEASNAALAAGITPCEMQRIVLCKWRELVGGALDDHILSEEEEARLKDIASAFSLTREQMMESGYLTKFVQAAILRDLKNGCPKTRISLDVPLPFKLQAGEVMLWAFPNTRLFERITKREIRGGSTGVSIRVMKGVYWRVGAFRGTPVSWEETLQTGSGLLLLTNKHLLFSGPTKNHRIPYSKLISIEPYADAIEVQRDTVTAKPQIFRDIDGQFAYNLIQVA